MSARSRGGYGGVLEVYHRARMTSRLTRSSSPPAGYGRVSSKRCRSLAIRSTDASPEPGSGFSKRRQVVPNALVMSAFAVQTTPGS